MIALWVAAMVVLDGFVGLAGAAIPERWLERYRAPMLGFAAGALLASGVGEVLPEAVARTGTAVLWWAAAAIAAFAVIELAVKRDRPVSPVALLVSDGLHNIGDGMAIAASFLVSIGLGVATSLAVTVHEGPEEIADYALLRASDVPRRRALLALAGVQLTAGIGASGTLLASELVARSAGVLMSLAGGTFVYIAVVDLLPDLIRRRSIPAFAALAAGAIAVLGLP